MVMVVVQLNQMIVIPLRLTVVVASELLVSPLVVELGKAVVVPYTQVAAQEATLAQTCSP